MAMPESGPMRVARVPLPTFGTRDRLQRWRLRLALALPLVVIVVLAIGLLRSDGGTVVVTPKAPLHVVHATWDASCHTCHEPWTPIHDAGGGANTVASGRCIQCHAGPPHHRAQAEVTACAACHHEHRGREASLVRVGNEACLGCHRNLVAHTSTGRTPAFADIRGFNAVGHPEFRAVAKPHDPGRLKFNHALHLTAGLRADPESKPFTLANVAGAARPAYAAAQNDEKLEAPVQLSCASCHVAEAGDGLRPDRGDAPRGAGRHMAPIRYEQHCRACHPLTYAPAAARADGTPPSVPHGLTPADLREYLRAHFTSAALTGDARTFETPVPARPLPGQLVDHERTQKLRALIEQKVEAAGRDLLLGQKSCGECHYLPADAAGVPRSVFAVRVEPTQVPAVWFEHASFDHKAHRAVECRLCHARAHPDHPQASGKLLGEGGRSHEDVLLPGIATCLECHSPRSAEAGAARGGARSDCVECHRYHHGDAPRHGGGAAARGVPAGRRLDLSGFLSGRPHD